MLAARTSHLAFQCGWTSDRDSPSSDDRFHSSDDDSPLSDDGFHSSDDDSLSSDDGFHLSDEDVYKRQAYERPRPLPPVAQQPRLPQGGRVPGDVRLPLAEELRQLADAELLVRGQRQQAQACRLGEHPVELPPLGRGEVDVGHRPSIYTYMRMNASRHDFPCHERPRPPCFPRRAPYDLSLIHI